ncbi:MAG: ABC-2 family transporter protein [Candidatus Magasanikbacteria bacterium]|nr:ABC-2 family transporter protein [Candidatus Magasanikbacteria bacterium]
MKKYFLSYKNAVSAALQYRLNLGLLVISHILSLSGIMYLWISVYESGEHLGTYSLPDLVLYYVLLTLLLMLVSEGVGLGFDVCEQINQGEISNYLLKPFSFSIENCLKLFAKVSINAIFLSPVIAILLLLFGAYTELPNTAGWIAFSGMTVVAALFYYLIYYFAALSSFWMINGRPIVYMFLIFSNLLNGNSLPLDLFPEWFAPVNRYSPFQFLLYVPIQIFLGRMELDARLLATAAVWILIFVLIIKLAWTRGIKKFEAVGR